MMKYNNYRAKYKKGWFNVLKKAKADAD